MSERLIVASNRLPIVLSQRPAGDWTLTPGSGGLVTALDPVLRRRGGIWIGWPGTDDSRRSEVDAVLAEARPDAGYELRGVHLSKAEQDDFYLGFSNQVIWPLFHDFQTQCQFEPRFWASYHAVNQKFAETIAQEARDDDFIWIHDYHLMATAEDLRARGVEQRIGFFLHIPFPPLDLFTKLPWRFEILQSLLQFDLIGFQTPRDRRNFLTCLTHLEPRARVSGEGRIVHARTRDRDVGVGVFPVSIDARAFAAMADSPEVRQRVEVLRQEYMGRDIILGVDRLDYSKGVPHKLEGFREALRRYPDLRGRVSLLQLLVPSREDIPQYDRMKREIERLIGEISGEFTQSGWVPIYYQYGRWERQELVAHYRMASVALVTPLKDGMNLVAKEYCATHLDDDGVLILSEYAGASSRLNRAPLLVNPYDVEGMARTIHDACTMPEPQRKARMAALRKKIQEEDIFWWVDHYLNAAGGAPSADLPDVELYRPLPPGRLNAFDQVPTG